MIKIPKKEPLNIVPFIDIMLVLLAMVLSISTFIAKGAFIEKQSGILRPPLQSRAALIMAALFANSSVSNT